MQQRVSSQSAGNSQKPYGTKKSTESYRISVDPNIILQIPCKRFRPIPHKIKPKKTNATLVYHVRISVIISIQSSK